MTYDFSKPQRQSASGIIIMAVDTLQKLIRALIIPVVIFIVKAEKGLLIYSAIGIGALALIVLLFSYLNYRRFTFFLDDHRQEFIINKGIFNRTLLTIPLAKIQQVNINQSILQQIIGVYSLQIDTPGSDSKEVSMKAIDQQIAYQLKEHLLSGKKTETEEATIIQDQQVYTDIPVLNISIKTLFKVGLTSNYGSSVALLIGFAYALFHNAKELIRAFDTDNGQVEAAIKTGFSLFSVGILITLLLLALLAINIVRTYIRHFDFKISKHKHSLLITAGLFTKKNKLLSPNKVQVTSYSQNYFQKKFNLLNMNLKQAESGHEQNEKEMQKSNLEVPGCNPTERDELLRMILGRLPTAGKTLEPNYRFLNLPIFFTAILPVSVFFIFWYNFEQIQAFYPLAIMYLMISIIMIYFSYRRHRLIVNQEFIIKRSGIWDIKHDIIFPHKIQSITTYQYPWHKSADIGHVNLHTAAGIIHYQFGNYSEIKQLVNYWLYQIESGSEEWM